MSHTPGPWIAECVGDSGGENPTDVYDITNGYVRIAEFLTEDDAKLIAEAPAMFDLLKSAAEDIKILASACSDRVMGGERMADAIIDLIARIEGKP